MRNEKWSTIKQIPGGGSRGSGSSSGGDGSSGGSSRGSGSFCWII